MKKDAYYFPHFSNARNDSKILKLRRIFGPEGYGIFFMLLEVLREQTDFKLPLDSIEDLSYEWHISKEKVLSVITDFDLFRIYKDNFFSPKLILYLQPYLEKSQKAQKAAAIRWEKTNANALPEHSASNASKVNQNKKVNENNKNLNSIDFNTVFNTQWMENVYRNGFKGNYESLLKYWEQFKTEMVARDDLYRTKEDYRKHFPSWVKIQQSNAKGENKSSVIKPNYDLIDQI